MGGLPVEVYSHITKIWRDAGTHGPKCLGLDRGLLTFSNTVSCFILGIIGNLKRIISQFRSQPISIFKFVFLYGPQRYSCSSSVSSLPVCLWSFCWESYPNRQTTDSSLVITKAIDKSFSSNFSQHGLNRRGYLFLKTKINFSTFWSGIKLLVSLSTLFETRLSQNKE